MKRRLGNFSTKYTFINCDVRPHVTTLTENFLHTEFIGFKKL